MTAADKGLIISFIELEPLQKRTFTSGVAVVCCKLIINIKLVTSKSKNMH